MAHQHRLPGGVASVFSEQFTRGRSPRRTREAVWAVSCCPAVHAVVSSSSLGSSFPVLFSILREHDGRPQCWGNSLRRRKEERWQEGVGPGSSPPPRDSSAHIAVRPLPGGSLLVRLGRQREMARALGPLPPTWETKTELLALSWPSSGCCSH